MLADPRSRPRENLSGVSVIDLLEPIGSARPQEFRVRRPSQLTSHNLYLTLPTKMCHASHSLREVQRRSPSASRQPPERSRGPVFRNERCAACTGERVSAESRGQASCLWAPGSRCPRHVVRRGGDVLSRGGTLP